MKLHEIEPGKWVVPELVDRVEARINYMDYTWSIAVSMLFGGEILCRRGQANIEPVETTGPFSSHGKGVSFRVTEDIDALSQNAAREVAAWIDERRIEPVELVR